MIEFLQENFIWTCPILLFLCWIPFILRCVYEDHKAVKRQGYQPIGYDKDDKKVIPKTPTGGTSMQGE